MPSTLERRSVRKPDHSDRLRFGDRLRVPECDPLQPARRAPGGVDDRSDVESAHGIDPARAEDAQTANEKAVWVFARASLLAAGENAAGIAAENAAAGGGRH